MVMRLFTLARSGSPRARGFKTFSPPPSAEKPEPTAVVARGLLWLYLLAAPDTRRPAHTAGDDEPNGDPLLVIIVRLPGIRRNRPAACRGEVEVEASAVG